MSRPRKKVSSSVQSDSPVVATAQAEIVPDVTTSDQKRAEIDSMFPVGSSATATETEEQPKPRRKRRTKAEMESARGGRVESSEVNEAAIQQAESIGTMYCLALNVVVMRMPKPAPLTEEETVMLKTSTTELVKQYYPMLSEYAPLFAWLGATGIVLISRLDWDKLRNPIGRVESSETA
jgi:hypothetical protein